LVGQGPGFVDHDQPPPRLVGVGDGAPDGVQGQQRPHSFELLGQVTQRQHQQVAVGAVAGRLLEQPPKAARDKRGEAGGQLPAGRVGVLGQGVCQVGQEGRGAVVGAGVAGDPFGRIGGDRGPVQHRGRGGAEGVAEQDRDQGVAEQRPAGQRIRLGSQLQGVEMDAGGAQGQGGATDRLGQPLVLALRVHDQDLDALI
jgi:hypothetical protein